MSEATGSNIRGALIALVAFGIFATHDVAVKILGGSYTPFQIIFFSVLMSFPLATLMLIREATPGLLRPVHPWWIALRMVATSTTAVSAFYAFSVLPLAQTYTILFAQPIMITVLSIPVLGERVGPHRWFAVVLGLVGVLIVLRPGAEPLSLGHGAALLAAFGSALTSVVVRKIGREERSAVLMLYPMMSNVLVMGAVLPFVYQPMPLADLGLIAVIAVFGFAAALCVILAYRAGDATVVAPMQYSQILWAAGFGYLFFGETPDALTWVGAAVIIASGLYIVVRESRAGASRNTPVLRTRSRHDTGTLPRISTFLRGRDGNRHDDR